MRYFCERNSLNASNSSVKRRNELKLWSAVQLVTVRCRCCQLKCLSCLSCFYFLSFEYGRMFKKCGINKKNILHLGNLFFVVREQTTTEHSNLRQCASRLRISSAFAKKLRKNFNFELQQSSHIISRVMDTASLRLFFRSIELKSHILIVSLHLCTAN